MKPVLPTYSFHPTNAETTGWLTDAARTVGVPVVSGLVLADQSDWPLPDRLGPRVAALDERLAAALPAYEEFSAAKVAAPYWTRTWGFSPSTRPRRRFSFLFRG